MKDSINKIAKKWLKYMILACVFLLFFAAISKAQPSYKGADRPRWGREYQAVDDRWVLSDSWIMNIPGWMTAPGDRTILFGEYRGYTRDGKAENRNRYRILHGISGDDKKSFDLGIEKEFDSDNSITSDELPAYFMGRFRYVGIGEPITLGLHLSSVKKHYSTAYIFFRFIGVGINFGGSQEKGGRARFGGCGQNGDKVDNFYFMAGGEMQLSPWGRKPWSLLFEYDGDEFGLGAKYRFNDRMALDSNWRRKGDYHRLFLNEGKNFDQFTFALKYLL